MAATVNLSTVGTYGSNAVKPGQYQDLLEEMLDKWTYATNAWSEIREEAKEDMRYVAGNPWTDQARRAREAAGRPVGSYDEISQYTNQVVNDIRQHKRAINVTPTGAGANDQTAEFRRNLFRQIEYRSNAQQAYTCMFQNAVERSYGFFRIKSQFCTTPLASGGQGSAFNQELMIEPLVNPDLVTGDPDGVKPDGSDWQYAWIAESWDLKKYKKRFPQARVKDFSADLAKEAPTWMDAKRIRVAEYFTIETTQRCLYLFSNAKLPGEPESARADLEVFEDDLDKNPAYKSLRHATPDDERDVDVPTVKKYLTNGFEVLEAPTIWPGKTIPIVACYGKVIYVDEGSGAEKHILSLVRLARDPYMLYCYIRACEQELVGMTPKVPYFVRRGSLKPDQLENLQKSLHEPVAVIEVETISDHTPAGVTHEMPERNPYEPAIAPLESLAEAARRAIQSAMGISPLPTNAQRINDKSGKALQEIHDSEQQGSFHLVDAYESAITRGGAILNEVCPVYYDTPRDVTTRSQADETAIVRINDDDPAHWPDGQTHPIDVGKGEHDVTLSAGPSFDSEREAANDFADTMIQNIGQIAQIAGPKAAAKIMATSIKLKNLGPLGDEMAEAIDPPDPTNLPPQIASQLQQLTQENQSLKQEKAMDTAKATVQANSAANVANINGSWGLKKQIVSSWATAAATDAKIDAENARTTEEMFNDRAMAVIGAHETAAERAHDRLMKASDQAHDTAMQSGEQGHDAATLALEHAHAAVMGQMPPPVDPNTALAPPSAGGA